MNKFLQTILDKTQPNRCKTSSFSKQNRGVSRLSSHHRLRILLPNACYETTLNFPTEKVAKED